MKRKKRRLTFRRRYKQKKKTEIIPNEQIHIENNNNKYIITVSTLSNDELREYIRINLQNIFENLTTQ